MGWNRVLGRENSSLKVWGSREEVGELVEGIKGIKCR